MQLHTASTRDIAASPSRIWELLGDEFATIGTWASTIASSRASDGARAPGLGSRRVCEVPGFGETREEIVEWEEGRRLAYSAEADRLPSFVSDFLGSFELLPTSDGTEVTQTIRATLSGWRGRAAGPMMRWQMGRAQRAVLIDLEAIVTCGHVSARKQKLERKVQRSSQTSELSR